MHPKGGIKFQESEHEFPGGRGVHQAERNLHVQEITWNVLIVCTIDIVPSLVTLFEED